MDAKAYTAAIAAAKAENEHGIEMRRGKKYTSVAIRVEVARRHLGNIGIETEIVQLGVKNGEPVIIRAKVTDETGRVIGCGTAQEIVGSNNVNRTSALENAETSAIGRAMASLGLSGGEFASANEMDGVDRKEGAKNPEPEPDEPTAEEKEAAERKRQEEARNWLKGAMSKKTTQKQLHDFRANEKNAKAWEALPVPMQNELNTAYNDAWNRLPDDPALQGQDAA